MIEEFNNYVRQFNMDLDGIHRKYNHSIRVMNLSKKYAKLLGFKESDIELAAIIGLLHDIGRFEQYQKYQSFDDLKTINHASLGVKILFEDGLINKFTNRTADYELIKFAILNHNKLKIDKSDNKRYIKFAKLIRDIDKLDIIYLLGYLNEFKSITSNDEISTKVKEDINNHILVDIKDIININDQNATKFAYVFDINNDIVLKELKRNYYYYYKVINRNGIFNDIYHIINNYIDERIDNYVG